MVCPTCKMSKARGRSGETQNVKIERLRKTLKKKKHSPHFDKALKTVC